jgi:hypothetical protein
MTKKNRFFGSSKVANKKGRDAVSSDSLRLNLSLFTLFARASSSSPKREGRSDPSSLCSWVRGARRSQACARLFSCCVHRRLDRRRAVLAPSLDPHGRGWGPLSHTHTTQSKRRVGLAGLGAVNRGGATLRFVWGQRTRAAGPSAVVLPHTCWRAENTSGPRLDLDRPRDPQQHTHLWCVVAIAISSTTCTQSICVQVVTLVEPTLACSHRGQPSRDEARRGAEARQGGGHHARLRQPRCASVLVGQPLLYRHIISK